jgi:hypothetical protein
MRAIATLRAVIWSRIGLRRIKGLSYMNMKREDLMMEEMGSDRDRLDSNRTPRFRADEMGDKVTEGVMEREEFSYLETCLRRPISKSSVSEGLSIRRFADIYERLQQLCVQEKKTISRNLLEETETRN